LAKCKAKLVAPSAYNQVWTSQGTQSANRLSVWAPDLEGSMMKRNKAIVCLGHFAMSDFANPSKDKSSQRMVLEVRLVVVL
jgi:hypothetical protein